MARVGRKRSDRRWEADGRVWASKFEWRIYDALKSAGVEVRPCDERDSLDYVEPVSRGGRCLACGSNSCVQERVYTPDLCLDLGAELGNRYIEAKGYFPAEKRSLFRHFRKSNPDTSICVVLEADLWVSRGKSRLTDYFRRYLKDVPVMVYRGDNEELRRFILEP